MGQCVSRKAGAVIAASGYSPSYRIMEKKPSKNQGDNKSASKRGAPHTRGTAISFGFRRRPAATGIPVPITNSYQDHQRSKSVGPEHESRRRQAADDDYYQPSSRYQNYSSSGRSTPRLAPPKKESSGLPIRTNRFGFRNPQQRFTDKVTDLSTFHPHTQSHLSHQEKADHFQSLHQEDGNFRGRQSRSPAQTQSVQPKPRAPPSNQTSYNNNNNNNNNNRPPSMDGNRKTAETSGGSIGKYTLHTSHLPLPQFAVRMTDASSKIAKTAANQSRKVGAPARSATCSSKEGSGTEDSGLGSQHGCCSEENGVGGRTMYDCFQRQANTRPRKLAVMVNGKSFDVRDIDDDNTVTEISVIPLPKSFVQPSQPLQLPSPRLNINTGLVRERANQYQRTILSKDNRYITDSTTSMSTTSSEGYDEGLGEEKVYKDRSRTEKLMAASSSSSSMMRSADFSPPSSDEQEFGHGGEAMADEYSFSSSDDYKQRQDTLPVAPCNTVTQTTTQHFKAISNAAKSGALPKSTLRSVLLTIEDPAFAAVAATTTTLIDDETSPVDSLFDSPTASVSQEGVKIPKKEANIMERSGNTIEDDSPGTPTNASNSLSLSEGREYFDDEIADQPGLVFDETLRDVSTANTDHSQTLLETVPKGNALQGSVENSPMHGRKMNRAGSVSTLSSCESLASDDLMMDYERSDASSYGDISNRGNSAFVMQDLDDATSMLELEIQGQEVLKDWNTILGETQQALSNSTNNNISFGLNNNQNTESGLSNSNRTTRLLHSRSSTESPRSLDSTRSRQVFSPLRPPRNVQSPSFDSGDEGSLRIERGTYSYMFQDIVSIKTMLLKLKRVLQESGENGLTRTDSLNPFDNSLKNGLSYNLNDGNATTDASTSPNDGRDNVADELADLRRQVVFLQGQIDDKDRFIQNLQAQLTKYQTAEAKDASTTPNGKDEPKEMVNATTQTDKLRPVSAGPSILQGLSQESGMGLVSWNDSWSGQAAASAASASSRPAELSSGSSKPPSRRSSDSAQRPASLRGPRLPAPQPQSQPQPQPRSAIPTPRRLAAPTLIPRAARAVSATGRAHNS